MAFHGIGLGLDEHGDIIHLVDDADPIQLADRVAVHRASASLPFENESGHHDCDQISAGSGKPNPSNSSPKPRLVQLICSNRSMASERALSRVISKMAAFRD